MIWALTETQLQHSIWSLNCFWTIYCLMGMFFSLPLKDYIVLSLLFLIAWAFKIPEKWLDVCTSIWRVGSKRWCCPKLLQGVFASSRKSEATKIWICSAYSWKWKAPRPSSGKWKARCSSSSWRFPVGKIYTCSAEGIKKTTVYSMDYTSFEGSDRL